MTDDVLRLRNILAEVGRKDSAQFTGVGVIFYDEIGGLPIFPLRSYSPDLSTDSIDTLLRHISTLSNEFHDGFHLISNEWAVTHVAQYFSPPIVRGVSISPGVLPGGRYMAALFGSAIKGVKLTAILGADYRLAIFRDGAEILGEDLR